ncbi:MAG TPA: F0F1 ATP synthase subunit A [Clostridiales bacterium]|nr:F0F1 ATP synthase subunit A [Clostridiales bacterium]
MHINPPKVFEFTVSNQTYAVTMSIILQWIIMAVIIVLVLLLTRNLGKIPSKRQTVIEMIVNMFNNLVVENLGESFKKRFVPFIGTLGIFIAFMNLTGVIGFAPSTRDINVTATLAIISAIVINGTSIARNGLGRYLHSYLQPFALMLPMNIIEKFTVPLSLCLRLFINMLVGVVFMELIYMALGYFAFIIPILPSFFFDVFVALIQTYVFVMLTIVFTKTSVEE